MAPAEPLGIALEHLEPRALLTMAAPTNLIAIPVSPTQIDVAWEDNSTYETGFRLEARHPDGAWSLLAYVGANTGGYSHTGLHTGAAREYRVRAVAGDGGFSAPAHFNTLPTIRFSLIDFDGDGYPDIAAVNPLSDTVTILRGLGDGTFTEESRLTVGREPAAIAVADLNNDTYLDLAVTNWASNDISILLGRGDGSFAAASPVDTYSGPFAIAVGDLDDDGNADIATTHILTTGETWFSSVLLGRGDGTFIPHRRYLSQYGVSVGFFSIGIGTIYGDDYPPAAVTTGLDSIASFTLDDAWADTLGVPFTPWALSLADLDSDGRLDVASTARERDGSPSLRVLLSSRDVNLHQDGTRYDLVTEHYALATGDIDADGTLDIVAATTDGLSVFLGEGAGSFQYSRFIETSTPVDLALGDVDQDGLLDIVVSSYAEADATSGLTALRGRGSASAWSNVDSAVAREPHSGDMFIARFHELAPDGLAEGDSIVYELLSLVPDAAHFVADWTAENYWFQSGTGDVWSLWHGGSVHLLPDGHHQWVLTNLADAAGLSGQISIADGSVSGLITGWRAFSIQGIVDGELQALWWSPEGSAGTYVDSDGTEKQGRALGLNGNGWVLSSISAALVDPQSRAPASAPSFLPFTESQANGRTTFNPDPDRREENGGISVVAVDTSGNVWVATFSIWQLDIPGAQPELNGQWLLEPLASVPSMVHLGLTDFLADYLSSYQDRARMS